MKIQKIMVVGSGQMGMWHRSSVGPNRVPGDNE